MHTTGVHFYFVKTAVDREKAEMLALGGINLARAALTSHLYEDEKERKPAGETEKKEQQQTKFLERILPHLNRWQVFDLEEKIDGLEGEVKICISCEDGKININKAFDFRAKKIKPEFLPLFEKLEIKRVAPTFKEKFVRQLTDYLVKRGRELDDISELLEIEGFENLDLFYNPPRFSPPKYSQEEIRHIALQDLFTVWSEKDKIELLFSSDSFHALLDLRRPKWNDAQAMKDQFKKVISKFKSDLGKNWKDNWETVQPILGRRPDKLELFQKILSQQFDPSVYTVISCGKVNNVEQKLLAVLVKQKETESKTGQEGKKEATGTTQSPKEYFNILKVYWL